MASSDNTDRKDKRIIDCLLRNGRAPYAEIANSIGLSESAVRKRVERLVRDRVIDRFTIALNPEKTGRAVISYITVSTASRHESEVIEGLVGSPLVTEAYWMSGKCGIWLKVETGSLTDLTRFIEGLRLVKGILSINSCIALRPLKVEGTPVVPLPISRRMDDQLHETET
ncbi:MAG: Lrp/AsnC family transcriptional regulator [Promethearchaeati archaeon SRVP18_Atabeyarchaeia-1]